MFERMQHYTQYVQEYKNLKQLYVTEVPVILCTYYAMNQDVSIYDDSYESPYEFVGNLSGIKYDKVTGFPVFYSEYVANTLEDGERGARISGAETQVTVALPIGLRPKINDLLVFEDGGAIAEGLQPNILYRVKNLDFSNVGDNQYSARLAIEPAPVKTDFLEQQILTKNIYIDTFTSIFPISNSTDLISTSLLNSNLIDELKLYVEKKAKHLVLEKEFIFPTFLQDIAYYYNIIIKNRTDQGSWFSYSNFGKVRETPEIYTLLDLLFLDETPSAIYGDIIKLVRTNTKIIPHLVESLFGSTKEYEFNTTTATMNMFEVFGYDIAQIGNIDLYMIQLHNYKNDINIDLTGLIPDSVLTQTLHDYLTWTLDKNILNTYTDFVGTNLLELVLEYKISNEQMKYVIDNKKFTVR